MFANYYFAKKKYCLYQAVEQFFNLNLETLHLLILNLQKAMKLLITFILILDHEVLIRIILLIWENLIIQPYLRQ